MRRHISLHYAGTKRGGNSRFMSREIVRLREQCDHKNAEEISNQVIGYFYLKRSDIFKYLGYAISPQN